MKKKGLIILFAAVFLAVAISGTIAYFVKDFASDNNTATAKTFDVDVVNGDGETIGNADFDLDEELYPGMDKREVYTFDINKNNTDLPVEYSVDLSLDGELFNGPVALTLERNIDGEWTEVDYSTTFRPENDTESYRVLIDWPHGENDIAYQGKTGNVKLEVVASQVDPEDEPEEPVGPPYFTGEVKFKATQNGSTRTTSNKEVNFYVNDDGYKVIEVSMGDGEGDFEEKVGNVTITGETHNGRPYYRVFTDNEYFASETRPWRSAEDRVDTSVEGIITFNGIRAPYLSIESQELYNWFINN